jgi:hypothetical protein
LTNSADVKVVGDGIQVAGSGNPFAPPESGFWAAAMARSNAASAESRTTV